MTHALNILERSNILEREREREREVASSNTLERHDNIEYTRESET